MISWGPQFDPLGTRKKKTGKDKVTHAYLLATRVRRTHRVASVLSHSLFTSIWAIYLNVNAPNQRTDLFLLIFLLKVIDSKGPSMSLPKISTVKFTSQINPLDTLYGLKKITIYIQTEDS